MRKGNRRDFSFCKSSIMIPIPDPASIQPPEMTFVAAVWMGALTSVHVCAVARLPILAAYLVGAGVSKKHALILTVLFAAGLAAGTVLVGLTAIPMAGGVHRAFQVNKCLFWILGSFLVVVGVLISGLINLQLVPGKWRSVAERLVRTDGLGALLLGIALGLLQIPACPTCRAELLRVVESAAVGGLPVLQPDPARGFHGRPELHGSEPRGPDQSAAAGLAHVAADAHVLDRAAPAVVDRKYAGGAWHLFCRSWLAGVPWKTA